MRKTTCNLTCENQMLTMTRIFRHDSCDPSKQVVSSFNKNITESNFGKQYLIATSSVIKL